MKMAPNNGKKIKYFISVLLIVGSFLFFSVSSTQALLNDYNKPYNGTLTASEWNNLDNDFLNRTGIASMEGPLSITLGGLTVNGTVSATSFAGALNARNVSSGIFGADQGGGNFIFNDNLAIGSTNPASYTLDVAGDINFTGTLRQNGVVFTGSKWTSNALNIYYNTGNVGIGLTNPGQQLDVNLGLRAQSLILKGFAGAAGIVMTDAAGLLYSATSPEGNITLPGGTNGATLRYDSTSGNWLSNTFLFNNGTSLGIGTTNPGSLLTIANNQWMSSRNGADTGIVNMFKVNSSNQIEVGAPLIIGPLEFAEDSGLVSFLDMPVTSSATLGTPEGYTIKIDGNNLFTLYSESNGAGGVQNMRLGVGTTNPTGDLTIGGTGTRSISRDRSTGNLDLYGGSTYTDGAYFKVTGSTLNTSPGNSSGEFTIGEYTGTYASTFKINSFNGSTWTPRFLVMGSTGNVGIGVTNPIEMLHVGGTAQFDDVAMGVTPGSTQSLALTTVEYVNNMVTGVSTSTVGYWSANGTNIYNANSGNVGIGTSNPLAKFYVSGQDASFYSGTASQNLNIGRGATERMNFLVTDGTANLTYIQDEIDATPHNFEFNINSPSTGSADWIFKSRSVESFRITSSGNIGIGTSNPGSKLSVNGGATFGGGYSANSMGDGRVAIQNYLGIGTGTNTASLGIVGSSNPIQMTNSGEFDIIGQYVGSGIGFILKGRSTTNFALGAGDNEIIRMTIAGNVGIGKTNPVYQLDVAGTANFDGLATGVTPGTTQKLAFTTVEYVDGMISGVSTSTVGYWSANGTNIYNANSGNVGIGVSSPGSKLSVQSSGVSSFPLNILASDGSSLMKLYETSGGDAGLYIHNAAGGNVLYLSGNGNSYINSGNVGIGTTAPTQKLNININSSGHTIGINPRGLLLQGGDFGGNMGDVGITFSAPYLAGTPLAGQIRAIRGSGSVYIGLEMSTVTDHPIRFLTNSTSENVNERMRITSSGNIGISTTNPTQKLHVNGGAQLDAISFGTTPGESQTLALTTVEYVNAKVGGSAGITTGTTGQTLRHDGTGWVANSVLYNNGTNIGIGTNAPTQKLHLKDGRLLIQNSAYSTNPPVIELEALYPTPWKSYIVSDYYGAAFNANVLHGMSFIGGRAGFENFRWFKSDYTELMTLRYTGNLGIATTNPTQKLHVNGGAQLDSVSFGVTPGTTQKLALATVEYIDNMISGVSTSTVGYWSANGNHIYNANSANVGIGSSAPANKLDISGSLGIDGILKGYGSANGNFFEGKLGVNSLSAGASSLAVFGNAAIGTSYLSTSAPINGLIVQGNVGIATSTPAEALHIVGNLRVDGGATISGNLNMSGSTLIVNKITANTIDPLYTIGGVKYSTFAPSIVGGVKEEYVGRIYEDDFRKVGVEYEAVIDMSKLEEGSDLWVWHKVVDFSSDNVSVFLTPKGERASMYADIEGDKIVIRSDRVVDAYLRLIGSRYDWHEWPTKASDQNQPGGLLIN